MQKQSEVQKRTTGRKRRKKRTNALCSYLVVCISQATSVFKVL